MFTHYGTTAIEFLRTHIVEVSSAVDRGEVVGFGDEQRLGGPRQFALRSGQCHASDIAAGSAAEAFSEHSQPGPALCHQAVRGAATLQTLVAVTQKGEAVVCHPTQQCAGFADFFRQTGRMAFPQCGGEVGRYLAHGTPIFHGSGNVFQGLP